MKIEFISSDQKILEHFPIKPAKQALPEWFKDLPRDRSREIDKGQGNYPEFLGNIIPTIKKCMPVGDLITAGYIIPNAYEQKFDTFDNIGYEHFSREMNMMSGQDPANGHHYEQCPVKWQGDTKKNYFKILLPWRIVTPPGYSSLFFQPFYRPNDRYTMLPSIIDTDQFDGVYQNFPGYLLKNNVTIESGEPLIQVIPFKRDDWKMESRFEKPSDNTKLKFFLRDMYARAFHKKKRFN